MSDSDNARPLTTGEWLLTILICAIPMVGIVMMFVWAFGDGNIGRRNFFRAQLIILAIMLCLGLLVLVGMLLFGGLLAAAAAHH